MTSYEVITNQIIEKLNEGIIPWVKPWKTNWKTDGVIENYFPAYSFSNGKRYNLMNQMLLGFTPGEFATFEQIKKAGGKVKKGEKSSIVCGWIVEDKPLEDKDGNELTDENGNTLTKKTFALRYYRVFNILTQVEGIEPKHTWEKVEAPEEPEEATLETKEEAEAIINCYLASKNAPKFEIVKGSNEAYFAPALDKVVVPHISQYDSVSEYYGTIFHELTHSTGAVTRLNRKLVGMTAKGKEDYSKEELIAEIGSCFLNAQAGLNSEDYMKNATAYIQGWLKALRDDPKMIVQASAQAEKATEYILNA
jgi:antirestriction protein ArdC